MNICRIAHLALSALKPLAVRLTATGASDSGRMAGNALAVSAVGGAFGAALTGFLLFAHVPISAILWGTALLLILMGTIASWLSQRAIPLGQMAACAALISSNTALRSALPASISSLIRARSQRAIKKTPMITVNGVRPEFAQSQRSASSISAAQERVEEGPCHHGNEDDAE